MIKDLVNILTPAYNGEKFISRLLDSVLSQTYPYISMIIINDGSTDKTKEIVEQYIPKFKKKNFNLIIYDQINGGVSNAINNGLKIVDGEFLVWPDIDDWYASPNAIEKLVNALKSHDDDVAVARCAYNRINENKMNLIRVDYPCMGNEPKNIFEEAVKGSQHFWLEPGGWMIKTKFLDEFIPHREIYQSRLTGQNTQILWPYLFYKKCISVEEPLFSYLIRKNSHSRAFFSNLELKIKQQDEIYDTFKTVLKSIKGLDENKAKSLLINRKINLLKQKYHYLRLAGKWKEMHECYNQIHDLNKGHSINKKMRIKNIISYIPIIRDLLLKKKKKTLINIFIVLSLIINIIFATMYTSPKIARKYYNYKFTPISYNSEKDFENKFRASTLTLLNDNIATDESIIYYHKIDDFIHHILKGKELYSVFEYGEFGYFLHYLFQYAATNGDEKTLKEIKRRIDYGLLKQTGDFQVVRNDQCAYGCILLDLYNKYGDNKYKKIVDKMVNRLDSIDKTDGIVKYREYVHRQDVDCIGLVCPFLNMYSQIFKDNRTNEISAKMINQYARYGMDYYTGLPSQAYDTKSKIKIGYANWGRGCGWLCLGLSNVNKNYLDSISLKRISTLDSTLISMAPLYGQYLGQENESNIDMSSTIFILYYLKTKNIINLSKKEFINVISTYVSSDGFIKYNSPSISRPKEKPNSFQNHHVGQALALLMLTMQ